MDIYINVFRYKFFLLEFESENFNFNVLSVYNTPANCLYKQNLTWNRLIDVKLTLPSKKVFGENGKDIYFCFLSRVMKFFGVSTATTEKKTFLL